jgi:hypothetical protein
VTIADVGSLVGRTSVRVGTPTNWWSADASWMVYTDWDLWATKVSGPPALIASIESDARLECIHWSKAQLT